MSTSISPKRKGKRMDKVMEISSGGKLKIPISNQ
jgi:hypothetical protein